MRALAVLALLLAGSALGAGAETRCGWLENPTPGNYSLRDRAAEWELAAQGGYAADGMDAIPDMTTRGWVATNGSYGYGCACLDVAVDPAAKRVTRLLAARPMPLGTCRADRSLPRP